MHDLPRIQVSFYFSGKEMEIDEITKIMGMRPTYSQRREDFPVQKYAKSFWALDTEKEHSKVVSNVFQSVVEMLKEKANLIRCICSQFDCEVAFLINIWMENGEKPEMVLSKENISFANEISAEIGFDLYID